MVGDSREKEGKRQKIKEQEKKGKEKRKTGRRKEKERNFLAQPGIDNGV